MILKGQNFRILTLVGSKYKCIGMATGCTVTLTSNTEESSTKNDIGLASKPTVVSKSWTVSVESLDVNDAAGVLTAIKSLTPFTLMWDDTSTTDNRLETAAFARNMSGIPERATLQLQQNEKMLQVALQFTGSGELSKITTTPTYESVDASVYTKGQFVRLFLSSDNTTTPPPSLPQLVTVVIPCKALHLENATTRGHLRAIGRFRADRTVIRQSSTALMRGNDTITSAVAGKSTGKHLERH